MIDIVIVSDTVLQMHVIVNRSKNVFFCNMFRNQIVDISVNCFFDILNICIFFQNLCQNRIVNQLMNAQFFRIYVYIMAKINHHTGQNFYISLLCLNPYIRNCRILNCICQLTVNFLTCLCQNLACARIYNILCQYMSVDTVFQH